jgi:hypothetical protein
MCRPASMVLTKDKVFWSQDTESHSEIIAEFKLHEGGTRGINLACVELVPPENNFTKPLNEWVFVLDSERVPHWYDAAEAEARARASLPEWLAAKVVLSGQRIEKVEHQVIAVEGGTIQSVYGGTIQYVRGGTIQSVYGGTIQSVYGGTIQSVRGGTIQSVWGGANITYYACLPAPEVKGGTPVVIDRSGALPKIWVAGVEFTAKSKRTRKVVA